MTDGRFCDWKARKKDERYRLKCRRCGTVRISKTTKYRRLCPESKETPPPIQRLRSYAKATARWIAAGRPKRSDSEVTRIYDEVCTPCSDFDKERESCRICGCRVSKSRRALLNKLRMATESCPAGKW